MCYQVWTHTLRCSERPLIAVDEKDMVNSYAQPIACSCEQDENIKPWFRCPSHGCCFVTAKVFRCNEHVCMNRRIAHFYSPSAEADLDSWRLYEALDAWFLARIRWGAFAGRVHEESAKAIYAIKCILVSDAEVARAIHDLEEGKRRVQTQMEKWKNCKSCMYAHSFSHCEFAHKIYSQLRIIPILERLLKKKQDTLAASTSLLADAREKQYRGYRGF